MYGALRGDLPAKLIALFKIRDYKSKNLVNQLTGVQFPSTINSGSLSDVHGLVTVQMKKKASVFTVVDIWTILGLAHLLPEAK